METSVHDRVGTSLYRCRSFSLPSSVNTHARSTVRNGLMRDVDSQGLGMRNPIHHSLTIQAIPNMCTAVQFLTVYLVVFDISIALFVCVFNANPSCRNVDRVCSLVIPSCTNEFWSHGNFYLREVAIYS
jgi:hypothetical protein